MKPVNTLVERIDSAIDKILIDSVIMERHLKVYRNVNETMGKEMAVPHEETDYHGYMVAIELLGFNGKDYPVLVERMGTIFWDTMKDRISHPQEVATAIRELWQETIQEYIRQNAA